MIGKRGENPPLPRNCERQGAASKPLEQTPGRQPAADKARVRRPVQAQLPRGKIVFRSLLWLLWTCSFVLAFTAVALAAPLSNLRGTVFDPSGAAIPDA